MSTFHEKDHPRNKTGQWVNKHQSITPDIELSSGHVDEGVNGMLRQAYDRVAQYLTETNNNPPSVFLMGDQEYYVSREKDLHDGTPVWKIQTSIRNRYYNVGYADQFTVKDGTAGPCLHREAWTEVKVSEDGESTPLMGILTTDGNGENATLTIKATRVNDDGYYTETLYSGEGDIAFLEDAFKKDENRPGSVWGIGERLFPAARFDN